MGGVYIMMPYRERVNELIRTKNEHTRIKLQQYGRDGYFDTDDKGMVPAPDGFDWQPEHRHESGGWYGAKAIGLDYGRLLTVHPVYIDKYSALAGAFMVNASFVRGPHGTWHPDYPFPHLQKRHKLYDINSGIGSQQHFHHDIENIGFKLGWGGILQKIRHYKEVHAGSPEKLEFLTGEENIVLGIQSWIKRNAEEALAMAGTEPNPDLKENLREMARINFKLVSGPPETFHEACQFLAWFLMQAIMFNNSGAGGALDGILKPFFDRDRANGILDEDKATYILASLLVKDNQYYEIGGVNPDGSDRTNRLSFLVLEAAHWLRIPNCICLGLHKDIDPELVRLAVKYLFEDKHGSPSFIGVKAMAEGFVKNGYDMETARRRVKVGCHWTALPGIEYTMNDTVKINFAKVFEVAFRDMMDDPTAEPDTGRLWEIFKFRLKDAVDAVADSIDWHMRHISKFSPEMALNFMCHGPVERGLDIADGGVDHYNMCVDGAGLGVAADCFASLKQRVDEEKRISWAALDKLLADNWKGAEDTRRMFKSTPRYGSGGSPADAYAVDIVRWFTHCVKHKKTDDGYNMIPGLFSWANTLYMGMAVGATPNGRLAGEPITHGANPEPGFKENGALTAMAHAVSSVQPLWGNSAPIQLEIDPILGKDEGGVEKMAAFLMTYCCDMNGTLVNINILDKDRIMDAHKNPDSHPDLVVRVTGFSAYFSNLSPKFRQLVVDRIIAG
jgi:formate C-acetyltransferase